MAAHSMHCDDGRLDAARPRAARDCCNSKGELIMHAKPVVFASVVCAALLAAGCGERSSDTMARNDTATPSAPSPPIVSPAAPSATPSAPAQPGTGAKMADAISDTALTAKVKTALVAEPELKSTSIEVSTKDSVVTLSGTVESATDKAKARMVAENVQGVKNVVDNMALKS
jgi:hypothetical protein